MKKLIVIAALVLVSLSFLNADVYIKRGVKSTNPQVPQQSFDLWIGKNKIAANQGKQTYILNADLKKLYIINHTKKTYVESSLPLDITKIMPPEMLAQINGTRDQLTVTVTPNGKTNTILNIECTGYTQIRKIMGQEIIINMWTSTKVPFDWKSVAPLYNEFTKAVMPFLSEKAMNEVLKAEGFQLGQDATANGMTTTITTEEINPKKVPPAGLYSVPAGYTKKEMLEVPGV